MVTMRKHELQLYLTNIIERMSEDSMEYERFSNIFLLMCGVIDQNGNMTSQYAESPYWAGGNDGTPLRASDSATLLSQLSSNVQAAIDELDAQGL